MERDDLTGISRELEEALEQMERKEPEENTERVIAWKEPQESTEMLDEPEQPDAPEGTEEPEETEQPAKVQKKAGRLTGVLKPADGLAAAFFIPVLVLTVIFAMKGIYPFGTESFLRIDMYHQYAPFFSEFHHKLKEGGDLLYSWDVGMGVNFTALYAYYLASPFNWLLILCPDAYIIEFMTLMVVVKTGLCGLSFAYYLRKHTDTQCFGAAWFGIFYALSGYMAAYSWNIMWLDCIILFPLVMLGLERLVKKQKGCLYCVTLGLCILSNYYISIMICFFMVVYYFCLLILERKNNTTYQVLIGAWQFLIYSLLAGGMAAVILLPEIHALMGTASGDFGFPAETELYFPMFDMIARHVCMTVSETGLDHWPNIYCGTAVFLFFFMYLLCRKIPAGEKAVYTGLLVFLLVSFSNNILNFIWHGFHYPNSLPCRQSFIYIFLLLTMCYRVYQYLDEIPKKQVAAALIGTMAFLLLAEKLVTDDAFPDGIFLAAGIFTAVYAGIIYFYKNPGHTAAAAGLLTVLTVILETTLNTAVTSVTVTSRTAYTADNRDTVEITRDLENENGFYRIDKTDARTKNDGAFMNFPSVSLFSSMAYENLSDFMRKIGCEGSVNAYSLKGATPLVDSLLSVRYGLYPEPQENPEKELLRVSGGVHLYENPDVLPLGFLLPDIMESGWSRELQSPIEVQNDLASVLGAPEILEDVGGTESEEYFTFTAPADGEYYIAVRNRRTESVKVRAGGREFSCENVGRGYLLELGFLKAGETAEVTGGEKGESLQARACRFVPEALEAVYQKLNAHPFRVKEWEDSRLSGSFDAGEGGTLFLSIPYDEGWQLSADGEPVETRRVLDAFTGAELPAGEHEIVLTYRPAGLNQGAWLSGISLGLFLLIMAGGAYLSRRKKWAEEKRREA